MDTGKELEAREEDVSRIKNNNISLAKMDKEIKELKAEREVRKKEVSRIKTKIATLKTLSAKQIEQEVRRIAATKMREQVMKTAGFSAFKIKAIYPDGHGFQVSLYSSPKLFISAVYPTNADGGPLTEALGEVYAELMIRLPSNKYASRKYFHLITDDILDDRIFHIYSVDEFNTILSKLYRKFGDACYFGPLEGTETALATQ